MGYPALLLPSLVILLTLYVGASAAPGSRCPPPEKVYVYSKREECHSDSQCPGSKVCCPTPSRLNSCVEPAFGTDYADKYSPYKSKTTATGTYCGNVKCSPYEKCINDGRGRLVCRKS